ncbi:MAG: transcription antitermination factor NusB [Arcanobacterium sp.]|nr:transcription antitermination factor NusB [Arcanobacterium sp.]MDY5589768.1 transcription antitermination factor NusB [Arcanobacterium sp.]
MNEQTHQPDIHDTQAQKKHAARRSSRRKGRSLQRQRALDVLFEADVRRLRGPRARVLLADRQEISTAQQPIQAYGVQIVEAYLDNAEDIDSFIDAASPAWSLSRMSAVDRNILRIGAAELLYLDVERPVAVKEAASLAREFSSEKSVSFTMGVLNRVADIRDLETSGSGFGNSQNADSQSLSSQGAALDPEPPAAEPLEGALSENVDADGAHANATPSDPEQIS